MSSATPMEKHLGGMSLFSAALDGDEAKTRTLLEAGADVNETDDDGRTALNTASDHCSGTMDENLPRGGCAGAV